MLSYAIYTLITCLVTISTAIRVDWNTNKGPIIPPTPRTTVRPLPPYREPAPVWEDQSNDIPNPNSYVYVLPPPSRPRPSTNNYLTFDRRPLSQNEYYNYNNFNSNNINNNKYGTVITPNNANAYQQQQQQQHNGNSNSVAALSTKYIPNVGFKYSAVVPSSGGNIVNTKATTKYTISPLSSSPTNDYYYGINNNKFQGKFNAKTKKYKAYEKVKYTPLNYVRAFNYRYT